MSADPSHQPEARTRVYPYLLASALFIAATWTPWHADPLIRRAAGLVLATLVLWISEVAPLGVIALGNPIAAVFTGILPWRDAAATWGDPVVFLFLGAFLLARALEKHGAFEGLLGRRWSASEGASQTIFAAGLVLLVSGGISSFQNNTAVTAMLLPVVVSLGRQVHRPAPVLLALSYGATLGGMATPVGTAPNFIGYAAMKKLDASVSFLQWLQVGIPVWLGASLIAGALLAVAARYAGLRATENENSAGRLSDPDAGAARESSGLLPRPTPGSLASASAADHAAARRAALLAMAAAATIWLATGTVIGVTAPDHPVQQFVQKYLPESIVPVLVAWVLFLVRVGPGRRPVLDRRDFQAIDWDTLFLIAGGLCLGRVLEQSGAARALAEAVAVAHAPPLLLMFALAGVTVLLSELTSNTATAALMVPIAGALGPSVGLSAVQSIWLVALSASLGFALPVSTPPNAIIYGTRLVPLRLMAVTGICVDLLTAAWVVLCIRWFA